MADSLRKINQLALIEETIEILQVDQGQKIAPSKREYVSACIAARQKLAELKTEIRNGD